MPPLNKYVIIREDLGDDPVTIITEGLLIGRLPECELLLNHPAVSRTQAGIRGGEEAFYIFSLRPTNPVKLNGKIIQQNSALAAGDVVEVGPFLLEVDLVDDALVLKVSLRIGIVVRATDALDPTRDTSKLVPPEAAQAPKVAAARPAPLPSDKALDIFWDKRIRETGKIVKVSSLFPVARRKTGKAQFNWMPTSDLVSRGRVSILIGGVVGVGLLSIAAAFWYTNAFAPAPISAAHSRSTLQLSPPIALKANSRSCTSCHSFTGSMESRCASCHRTEAFVATVIEPHAAAGIGCVSCHAEHRGQNFQAAAAAITICTKCHNDANAETYQGKKVGTPHGGVLGYPVTNESWTWKGLSDADWKLKKISIERVPTDDTQQWRSAQFHALHVQRVLATHGMESNSEGQLSCSSCHQAFNPIDRETPRKTCGGCHNGSIEVAGRAALVAADKPNCISCHVQHVQSTRHWNPSLMVVSRTNK